MTNNTEELLKQAEENAKTDPKRSEQIYKDILGMYACSTFEKQLSKFLLVLL